jgi:hypothetical protein
MKKRRLPRNSDCPLTKQERIELCEALDGLEWHAYRPFKHLSGGFANASVYDYDKNSVDVQLNYGVDGQGESANYTADITLDRLNNFKISV